MNQRILITGSSGLIGKALCSWFESNGFDIVRLDLQEQGLFQGDVCDIACVERAAAGCVGVVHLAAVSRVIWGQHNPERCWFTNVDGLRTVIQVCTAAPTKPWLLFASSREVYGQPEKFPVSEDFPLNPINVYGRSKVEGERMIEQAQRDGLRACTLRLSNVFGSISDHVDRVVPAFVRNAINGLPLRVDGSENTFDFTYIDDVVYGFRAVIDRLTSQLPPPPVIHLVSGKPTSLGTLASLVISQAKSASVIELAPPRDFDVAQFYGTPARAQQLLGWQAKVSVKAGISLLIQEFQNPQGEHDPI
jgi:UDP-glucose 4-epimerase